MKRNAFILRAVRLFLITFILSGLFDTLCAATGYDMLRSGAGWLVSFDFNGGTNGARGLVPISPTNSDGTIARFQPALRTGYLLDGWYTTPEGAGEKISSDTVFTEDTTIYARWSTNPDYVTVQIPLLCGSSREDVKASIIQEKQIDFYNIRDIPFPEDWQIQKLAEEGNADTLLLDVSEAGIASTSLSEMPMSFFRSSSQYDAIKTVSVKNTTGTVSFDEAAAARAAFRDWAVSGGHQPGIKLFFEEIEPELTEELRAWNVEPPSRGFRLRMSYSGIQSGASSDGAITFSVPFEPETGRTGDHYRAF